MDLSGFDPFSEAVQQCPHPYYATMRAEQPVFRVPGTGFYLVSRHADVLEAVRDTETFSNQFPGPSLTAPDSPAATYIREHGYPQVSTLLTADPPEHTRYRALVKKAFTPRRVETLVPEMRAIAEELVASFVARGHFEVVREFAVPLPVQVIADALGVPRDDQDDFKRWSDDSVAAIGAQLSPERRLETARGIVEFQHYFAARIEERRRERRDDLLSDLVHARIEAEDGVIDTRPLDVPELLSILNQLLVAGNETTTKLITEAVRLLCEHPDQQARARAEPERIPALVEEVLRLATPTQGMFRVATRDTSLGGVRIPKGAMVVLLYTSANRDEAVFADPDRFDPDRDNVRNHLAFGNGIHFCVGASLARAETRVALEALLEHLDDLALAPGARLEYEPSFILRGLKELPVTFSARAVAPV